MSSPTKMTTRHAAATIAALTALLALPACRETVSCIDHPSPVCPDAFGYGLDANLPRDGGPDAPGLDANVDAFSAPDAYSPDSGTDGGPCSRCAPSSPACFMDGCVECTSENTSACTGGMPACDTSAHECVQCTSTSTSACTGATPACDATAHTCVECTSENTSACTGTTPSCGGDQRCTCTTTSCTSVSASRCDAASRACASCTMDGECSHLAGTPRCVGGTCMPCTVATEVADCGATSCNPATHTCTTTPRGSRTVCTTCVADSECGTGLTCAPVNPIRGVTGNYCLPQLPTPSDFCTRPYFDRVVSGTSASGNTVTYCRSQTTTCEAVLQHRTTGDGSCTGASGTDAACGAAGVNDGLCRVSGGGNLCTYPCVPGSNNDCRTGFICVTDGSVALGGYCGLDVM